MEANTEYIKSFELLQQVLMDAFNVAAVYHTPPYADFEKIDWGIRAAVWTKYDDEDSRILFHNSAAGRQFLIVKSNLGFYNLILTLQACATPDFISVGPFRDEELTPEYFITILKEANISPATIQGMRSIYETMPFAQLDAVVNVTRHIVSIYFEEFRDITPRLLQYAEQKREVIMNMDVLDRKTAEDSKQYQERLFTLLKYIKQGDVDHAKNSLRSFWQKANFDKTKNTKEYRNHLMTLNDYCHMALLETDIHPSHILKQATSLRLKLDSISSYARLEQMPAEICRKYCLLVKNYAHPGYSKMTKDIIAHIHFHMEAPLSLSYFADYFSKNATLLSNVFKKETGQTLTNYIQQVRMEEAHRLLHTTDLSISDIAIAVGYPDFSYFSKIFSRFHGCSPSAYRRNRLSKEI